MSLKQANCPSCQTTLRFKPTQSTLLAITCPTCGTDFQIRNNDASPGVSGQDTSSASGPAIVKATLLDESPDPPESREIVSNQPKVAKAVLAQPVNQVADQTTEPVNPIEENLPQFAQLDHQTVASANSAGPITQRKLPKRKSANYEIPWKAIIGIAGTFAGLGLLVGLAYMILSGSGGQGMLASFGGSSLTSTIDGYNACADDYRQTLESVEDDSGRGWAASEVDAINARLERLIVQVLDLEETPASEMPTDKLRQLTIKAATVDGLEASNQLTMGRASHESLVASITKTEESFSALREAIENLAQEDLAPSLPFEKVLYEGIEIEEELVRELAIRDSSGLQTAISKVQELSDRLNRLAEQQSNSGPQVLAIPASLAMREKSGQKLRKYLVNRISSDMSPDQDFHMTMKDFEYVENRFDQALFKYKLAALTTNSSQRVDGLLRGEQGLEKDPVASAYASSKKDQLLRGITSSASPPPSSVASNSYDNVSSSYGSSNTGNVPSEPYPDVSTPSYDSNFSSTDSSVAGSDSFDAGSSPRPTFGDQDSSSPFADSSPTGSSSSSASVSSPGGSSQSYTYADNLPARLKPSSLQGANSLTVRIFNASGLDKNTIRRRIASGINASTSYANDDNDGIVLSFSYSGPLAPVARFIQEGEIELSDSQSRTIFVQMR